MNTLESSRFAALDAPFACRWSAAPAAVDVLVRPIRLGLERLLGLSTLTGLYRIAQSRPEPCFADRAMAVLRTTVAVVGDLDAVPDAGPLIVVANHPHGLVDGLALASILARRRADVRLLANRLLSWLPDLEGDLLPVDVSGGRAGVGSNGRSMREAVRWIRGGGCLVVFPSGVVSHLHLRSRAIVDPVWHGSLGRLVHLTGARVVPCFIEGRNSTAFQLAGLVHPALRTVLLPRELLRRRGSRVVVHVGTPVEAHVLESDARGIVAALRARAEALPCRRTSGVGLAAAPPVVGSFDARGAIAREVRAVAGAQGLARSDAFTVFWMRSSQAPRLLEEIGRAREQTFGAVGEGTGRALDLDAFDERYLHLCVWDERAGRLVGAYRMAVVDPSRAPVQPLYTQTLFRYGRPLIDALAPALELGRAFVIPEYQKQYAPLMLLWTGIGRYVARHAPVRHLFGAVSISSAYTPAARDAMISALSRHAFDGTLSRLVTPRRPVSRSSGTPELAAPSDLRSLDEAVSRVDAEGRGLPVLLRQYLKLEGRVVGFSVDPGFGHVVDALMVVDLARAPIALLQRYMGRDEARAYIARWPGAADTRRTALVQRRRPACSSAPTITVEGVCV